SVSKWPWNECPSQRGLGVQVRMESPAQAAGGSFSDVGKLTIYLTELSHFGVVNEIMGRYFEAPYPARATVGVSALALNALVAIDATLVLPRKTA
ncbi:Rid family hydrolase, partial [Pseudomonas putida]|uniref:Rid family hydrolase n=1 Tax=Pseudomonas putida TaxID=303 RepID=UPI0035242754